MKGSYFGNQTTHDVMEKVKTFNRKVYTFLPVHILRVLSDMISFKLEELRYVVKNGEYDDQGDVAPALTYAALQCQPGSLSWVYILPRNPLPR